MESYTNPVHVRAGDKPTFWIRSNGVVNTPLHRAFYPYRSDRTKVPTGVDALQGEKCAMRARSAGAFRSPVRFVFGLSQGFLDAPVPEQRFADALPDGVFDRRVVLVLGRYQSGSLRLFEQVPAVGGERACGGLGSGVL